MKLIGISGKPGTTKMAYAFRIIRDLRLSGYSCDLGALALPLFEEFNGIAQDHLSGMPPSVIRSKWDLPRKSGDQLLNLMNNDLGEYDDRFGYLRSNMYVRQGLSLLGGVIRKRQDPYYLLHKLCSRHEADFVVFIDLRFPDEADFIADQDGYTIRIDLDEKVTSKIASESYKYAEGMKDRTETALDSYDLFHYRTSFFPGVYGSISQSIFDRYGLTGK